MVNVRIRASLIGVVTSEGHVAYGSAERERVSADVSAVSAGSGRTPGAFLSRPVEKVAVHSASSGIAVDEKNEKKAGSGPVCGAAPPSS